MYIIYYAVVIFHQLEKINLTRINVLMLNISAQIGSDLGYQ